MSYQKEFLQLPEGQIADVSFKFPTGLQKNGQYGPYFLYTIVHDGKEKFLKVTERLEKELRKMNIKTKQVYSLFKETIHPPKGEAYTVIRIVEGKNPEPVKTPAPQQPAAVQPLPRPEVLHRMPQPSSPKQSKVTWIQVARQSARC